MNKWYRLKNYKPFLITDIDYKLRNRSSKNVGGNYVSSNYFITCYH